MTTRAALRGKVAAILNERELVINLGADTGVTEGMVFKVIQELPEIRDPDTGASLGAVSREKIQVRVVEVQPKLCVGATFQTYKVGGGGLSGMLRSLQQPEETRVRSLRDSGDLTFTPLQEKESLIKVGDIAEEVVEETARELPRASESASRSRK